MTKKSQHHLFQSIFILGCCALFLYTDTVGYYSSWSVVDTEYSLPFDSEPEKEKKEWEKEKKDKIISDWEDSRSEITQQIQVQQSSLHCLQDYYMEVLTPPPELS